tara:strand:+ start:18220 stop:19458 length:1239 start_codon:yes stop_codon:yes gene_type:complete
MSTQKQAQEIAGKRYARFTELVKGILDLPNTPLTGVTEVNTLDDLSNYLVGSTYELPEATYVFTQDIDFGTRDIDLIDADGCYKFEGNCLPLVLYTGTSPFISSTIGGTGLGVEMFNFFISTPNATCVAMDNNNSFIVDFVVFVGCQKAGDISDFSFISFSTVPVVGCVDGFTADNVQSINMIYPQFNDNANSNGCYMRVLGAGSERLIASVIDARPESTECFLHVDATYGGDIAIGTGVLKTGGGTFFSTTGRDQDDPDIDIQNVKNTISSKTFANGHFDGNTTETVITTINTPVRINAGVSGWTDVDKSRFSFDSAGRWTYIGKETISKFTIMAVTVDPVGGGNKDVSAYLAKNGSVVATSRGEASASQGSQITSFANITLTTGDYLECFVENNEDTTNILVRNASFDDT